MLHVWQVSNPVLGAPMAHPANMRAVIKDWLESVMRRHNVTARQIALKSQGISPSTIYRAFEENGQFVMSTTKLAQIATAFGEDLPDVLARPGAPEPLADSSAEEVTPYAGPLNGGSANLSNQQATWTVSTTALDLEGYMPGDKVIVDQSVLPQPGDIVCARVFNIQRGNAETVLRLFQPPFLLTRSTNRKKEAKPLYVDNERVLLCGTVVRMVRERAA
jgi:DNA-binding phage protein